MPRPRRHPDPRTQIAVDALLKDPTMSVPQAMQAAGFSVEESRERAKQMWIRRRTPSRKSMKLDSESTSTTAPVFVVSDADAAYASATPAASTASAAAGDESDPKNSESLLVGAEGEVEDENFHARFSITSFIEDSSLVSVAEEEEEEEEEEYPLVKYKLRDWISLHRINIEQKQQERDSSLPIMTVISSSSSMRRKYLEQSVQILHSLAREIVNMMDSRAVGDKKVASVHPDFINVDNISILCDPSAEMMGNLNDDDNNCGGPKVMAAFFNTTFFFKDYSEGEVQNVLYAAMHAFTRIAYEMCMLGNGPSLPKCNVPLQNASEDTNMFLARTSLQNVSSAAAATATAGDGDGGDGTHDEEDEILDMMRKTYRKSTESDDINNNHYREFLSAMVDAGIPYPMRRFISDLLSDENDGIFRSDHSFASFEDVLSDLTQMRNNPDVFLHGSNPDRWKVVFGDKLYGRDVELEALMNAANRVVNIVGDYNDPLIGRVAKSKRNKTEVVMVSGNPGAGKSRLVRLGGAQLEKRGWRLLQCKFDRVVHPEPLSVLAHAFDGYFAWYAHGPVHRVSVDSTHPASPANSSYPGRSQQLLHNRLTSLISPEGLVILAMYIPSLRRVMDLELPAVSTDVNETLMAALFGALLQAISSKDSPIIFFIDDLQWADPLSLSILMALVKKTHSGALHLTLSSAKSTRSKSDIIDPDKDMHIMFVGSYREHAVDDNQPLAKALIKLQNDDSINMTTISLPGMTTETLNELLSDTLALPKRRVRQLSELVMQKTDGLPLFVTEFIRALAVDNLLTHNFTKGWEWDADSIEIFPITDSVAELFAFKLRRLPKDILRGLQIVSCFGCQVDQHVLDQVRNYDGENSVDIPMALDVALNEGLVERAAHLFSFSHDLIQKATIDSISEYDLVPLLRKLIAAFEKNTSVTDSRDSVLFVVVDLVNRIGSMATECPQERARFAELNLRAGTKAVAVPDFAGAAMYAENGIALLSDTCWETQYDLSLRLYEIAVLSHFSLRTGDREQLMNRIQMVFEHAHNFSDTFNTHRVWTRLLSLTNFSEAIEECLRALEQLGEPLDLADIDNIRVCEELEKQKERFSGESETLLTRSLEDQNKKDSLKIMSSLILYYTQSKSFLGAFVSCRMIEITMTYGYCEESIIGAVAFAASLVSSLGDIDGGSTWGRKAMALMKLCGNQSHIPTISLGLFGTVFVWKDPIQSTLEYLAQGIRSSFIYGDVEFAMINTYVYIARSFNSGKSIRVLKEEVEALARLHGICLNDDDDAPIDSPEILQYYMPPVYNILRDLQEVDISACRWRHVKNYDLMNIAIEKEMFACFHALVTNQTITEFLLRNMDSALNCTNMYFEHFEARKLEMMYICIYNVLYDGLINFYFMGRTGNLRYLERGERALSRMREWVRHSDWNFKNKFELMQAECYKVTNEVNKAAICYEESISAAKEHKFIHEEAMAHELAARFYLELGSRQRSYSHFNQSVACYRKWGAPVIARRIEVTMEQVFSMDIIMPSLPSEVSLTPREPRELPNSNAPHNN